LHLATTRLTLQLLTAKELALYIQDNQQLEQQLQLLPGSRQVPERLKKKIAETIIHLFGASSLPPMP
jgi:type III secretion system FlhB-like substrate exporter